MKSALLIIDVQRGLFEVERPPLEADAVVARINSLASRARIAGAPVVFVQHESPGAPLEFESTGWQLEARLERHGDDHFVRKTTPDSFLRTNLKHLLETLDVSHLVVCGYASEFCVDTTVRRAAALGYSVTLVSDAHTTHDKEHASAAAIRLHENATLGNITSFGPAIKAVASGEVAYAV
ncbi:cysteine hydrolase [Ramlibacter ginsenosidimutans]|uniref:Cysteine hydrolase n=1 Tax=Ramlibacter ginsenosidimutans TaxID=502333 RepID=A0A934WN47_9BURK|nr:cysteine hydrolase family protein [Ramlibacter ginsenosidimutans]MBK6007265.1 cysteine hydrolase [Ramlibacter ginsenosidimutans]